MLEHLLHENVCVTCSGGDDAGDSTLSIHSLLAAVPDRHHLRRISAKQTRAGQFIVSYRAQC